MTQDTTMITKALNRTGSFPKTGIVASRCGGCGAKCNSSNPMHRCFECKKKFHVDSEKECGIWGLQIKKGMMKNESARDVCLPCKEKHGYTSL